MLAAVFALAGVTKLVDRQGSREAVRAFGVPDRLADVVGLGLPLAEITVVLLLLPAPTRSYGAVAASLLLLAFCGAIAVAVARGESPVCHCFGQLHSAPAGWRTLVRNGFLAAIAVFIVVGGHNDPGLSLFSWASRLTGVEWFVLALAAVLAGVMSVSGYAITHVLRSYGRVLVRLDAIEDSLRATGFELDEHNDAPQLGLTPGTVAPAFSRASLDGSCVSLGDLLAPGLPALLLFTSPNCGPCSVLMPEVARWQREHADEVTVALLSGGDEEQIRADAGEHGLEHVLFDAGLAVYEAYEANGTPSAVLVGDDGAIASWLASGSDWIESLFEQALGGLGRTPGLPVGTAVPSLRRPQLGGAEVELIELVERDTVLLFWNPGCGYCRSMHDDLRSWEEARPEGSPDLLVVSAGSTEDVRAESFVSRVLLDAEWAVSGALGADGTPMAVLVGADGRIASPLVTGATGVLGLLGVGELSTTS